MKATVTRDKELKDLCGFKTYSGLIGYASILGIIILIIGIVCPYCYYNPTVIDFTKRTVNFWDLSFWYNSISVIAIIFAFGLSEIAKYVTKWRSRKKFFIISAVIVCILSILAFIMQTIACVFYKIPEQNFDMLEIEFDIGYYLFTIGCFIFAIANAVFTFLIVRVINGKITIEALTFIKSNNSTNNRKETTIESETKLTDKLTELQKLKNNGIITEEEYQTKKTELLNKFD